MFPEPANPILRINLINWTGQGDGHIMGVFKRVTGSSSRGTRMHRKFDLFEKFPDGSSLWRACALGLDGARFHLMKLAKTSENRFYAMDIGNGKIVHHNLDHVGVDLSSPRKMGRGSKSAAA
jgi:hypothetical protein